MLARSTVHRLLLKQLGEWVVSERLPERRGMNFFTTIGKGAYVFCLFIYLCVCWDFLFGFEVFFFFFTVMTASLR